MASELGHGADDIRWFSPRVGRHDVGGKGVKSPWTSIRGDLGVRARLGVRASAGARPSHRYAHERSA
jgi:hypothetical protein